jgi:hypothetical protein
MIKLVMGRNNRTHTICCWRERVKSSKTLKAGKLIGFLIDKFNVSIDIYLYPIKKTSCYHSWRKKLVDSVVVDLRKS